MIGKRELICGWGINDSPNIVRGWVDGKFFYDNIYMIWKDMVNRCYSKNKNHGHVSYVGCTIDEEWKSYTTFKTWAEIRYFEGSQIDKDILIPGNKLYGPETCCFVTRALNSTLTHNRSNKGKYPTGVSFHKGYYRSQCYARGERVYLGTYKTVKEAGTAYNVFKSDHVKELALEQTDERIKVGLLLHADLILNSPNTEGE